MSATSPKKLASTDEWRHIARVPNLYWHIYSAPGREEEGLTAEEFYASGEADWRDFQHQWRHYQPQLGGRCVEIGCGAGRLTRALAQTFASVVALDVSEDMIAHAREAVGDNVTFHQVASAEIPEPDASADAAISVLVLQHLDDFAAVSSYLREVFRVLRPGGTMAIDLSVARAQGPSGWRRLRGELEIWRSRRDLRKGRVHRKVRWREYPWEQTLGELQRIGFDDVQLRIFQVETTRTHYYFWFATKPGG